MRSLTLAILIVNCFFQSYGQPTYIKRLSFNAVPSGYWHPEDSILHVLDISTGSSGEFFLHASTRRSYAEIFKIDSTGQTLWTSTYHGFRAGLTSGWIRGLKATPDGGCIFANITRSYSVGADQWSEIIKLGQNGNVEWSYQLPSIASPYNWQETYDIAVLPSGYACLSDSLTYIFDLTGSLVDSLPYFGAGVLTGFGNNDIYVKSQNFHGRINLSGAPVYSLSGEILLCDTLLYRIDNDSLIHLDGLTGIPVSAVYFPPSGLTKHLILKSNGWISYDNDSLIRFRPDGSIEWAKHLHLPYFGMNKIAELDDHTLVTGGTYRSIGAYYGAYDYSAFIFTIDTLGNGVIDSTHQIFAGDANDDNVYEFADAIHIALALGATGPVRYDSVLMQTILDCTGDIAVDFPTSFATGINHKYSDHSGDGLVDSNDIKSVIQSSLSHGVNRPVPWRLARPDTGSTVDGAPVLSVIPEHDSASVGDVVRFYFIAGGTGNAIDSMYGLAAYLSFDAFVAQAVSKTVMNSDLGLIGELDYWTINSYTWVIDMVIGRKDFQNRFLINDTLWYVDILITDTLGNQPFMMQMQSFRVITAGGFEVSMVPDIHPLYINSTTTGIVEKDVVEINIYPNPADKVIQVIAPPGGFVLSILNPEGREILRRRLNSYELIEISSLPAGVYIANFSNDKTSASRKLIITD